MFLTGNGHACPIAFEVLLVHPREATHDFIEAYKHAAVLACPIDVQPLQSDRLGGEESSESLFE